MMKNLSNRNKTKGMQMLFLVLFVSAVFVGCQKKADQRIDLDTVPASFMITTDNYFDYQGGMECSAFSSAYVLRAFGAEAEGMKLFEDFPGKAPDGGIMPYGIVTFFNDLGYDAEYICDGTLEDIKKQITLGVPVIVFIHVEPPRTSIHNTHYVPIVGYDEEYLYLAESIAALANCKEEKEAPFNRKIKNAEFMLLWDNIDGVWNYPYFKISE